MKTAFLFAVLLVGSVASAETYSCYDTQECYRDQRTCSFEGLKANAYVEDLTIEQGVSVKSSTVKTWLGKRTLKFKAGDVEGYSARVRQDSGYPNLEYRAFLSVFRTIPVEADFLRNIWADDGRILVHIWINLEEEPITYELICEKVSK